MKKDIKVLVVKYITNQADPEETEAVKQWINASEENEAYYIQLYDIWQDSLYVNSEIIDPKKAYALFLQNTLNKKSSYRQLFSLSRIAVAASVLLILTIGTYYYKKLKSPRFSFQGNEIYVPKGSTKRAVLPDGTRVWINAGSYLKYAFDFGKTSRMVYLDGEAYFDIAENRKNIPFIVKAKRFVIKDIGTVFSVKAYSDDASFETVVFKGKVSVEGNLSEGMNEKQKIYLNSSQVLKISDELRTLKPEKQNIRTIGKNAEVLGISPMQADVYNGWKDDLLVFKGITFDEVAKILERKYDVKISIEDKELHDYEYTGSFKNVENINKALKILEETTPINYEITGRKITIRKK